MRIITGSTGTTHVTSNDDGEFNQGIFGNGLIVLENGNQLSASIVDNNTIRMADGDLILQGRHALIAPNTTEDIVIETGTVGVNRNDLIVARYVLESATGYESITAEVLKGKETTGTAIDPEVTTGDIRTGDMLVEAALYRVKIEGINIVALEPLFEVTESIKALLDALNINLTNKSNTIDELYRNMLIEEEEIHSVVVITRQGKKRLLSIRSAFPKDVNVLCTLDAKDKPSREMHEQILMVDVAHDQYYTGITIINPNTGIVGVHWFNNGSGANNIAGNQAVFGTVEWYVP